jgi:hypothetical protein
MKITLMAAVLGALSLGVVAYGDPVPRTNVPSANDPGAYQPVPAQKPLPPESLPQAPQQPQGPSVEDVFLQSYVNHRSPQIMIFVNRTLHGDTLSRDELAKAQDKQDQIGASPEDYELVEASLVKYFDASGRVHVSDADAVRGKLERAQVLRVENGDPQAARLLGVEFKQDILIRVTARPTRHSQYGQAVRLIAKAVGTADARHLGTAFVDMPLPMTKTNINVFTRYLSESLMDDMARKWAQGPDFDPVEIRIYKTASVDDALRIKKWLQATKGVQNVTTKTASGGSNTSYASFRVAYSGAPEDLYADLKDAIGASQGLKAVDLQNTTIDLEVTGKLDLVTTTRKSETITTTTTINTDEKKIEPINPAPAPAQTPVNPEPAPAPAPGM